MEVEHEPVWLTVKADSYEAVVSLAKVKQYPDSFLATLVELQLQEGSPQPVVRLDCDADEAREIVAVLRQGSRYQPPQDNPRLLGSLRHTLDFMGLPTPHFPCSSMDEVLLLPGYAPSPEGDDDGGGIGDEGLLMYSAATLGWAAVTNNDPRPSHVPNHGIQPDRCWLAGVLRSEYTSAGEDVVCMVPRDVENVTLRPVMLRASLKPSTFIAAPTKHEYCADAALAAASGKLYVLGGQHVALAGSSGEPSALEVFDPHTGAWYTASSPLLYPCSMLGHALVSNKAEGMLLVLGGTVRAHGDSWHVVSADVWGRDMVAKYDIRAGTWSKHPSDCSIPQAAAMPEKTSLAAVAADEHTIMLLRATPAQRDAEGDTHQDPGRVDLLDLRMWRWREGAALQRDCLHGVGLVEYDGKLLALGGCVGAWSGQNNHDEDDMYMAQIATDLVSSYDLRNDSWSQLPARMPVPLSYACPVVVRMPGVQL